MSRRRIGSVSQEGSFRRDRRGARRWLTAAIVGVALCLGPGVSQGAIPDEIRLGSSGVFETHLELPRTTPASWAERTADAPPYTRHLFETQIGGGPAWWSGGFGGVAQVQARFALWHTIGLGIYAGGLILSSEHRDPVAVVPVVGRLNLSLPFWRSFEPVAAIGIGPYIFTTENETYLGAQAALAFLFPGRRFGVETILHVTGDPRYSSELAGFLSLGVTALYR